MLWALEPSPPANAEQVQGYAAEILADPTLCRRMLQLQACAESSEAPRPVAGMWECNEGELKTVCILGLARLPASDEEKSKYSSVVEIACRGSKNVENWVTNFSARLSPVKCGACQGRAHSGFSEAYESIRSAMFENIRKSLTDLAVSSGRPVLVYVLGHSLGGALATLGAYDLATSGEHFGRYSDGSAISSAPCTVRCVTWGSPRVGDSTFAQAYISAVPSTARFVHKPDVVPRVPVNPKDPFDDGRVLGDLASQWLQSKQMNAGVEDFFHVCKGTKLGQDASGVMLALSSLNVYLDQGAGKGVAQLFAPHYMKAYAENMNAMLDPGAARAEPVVDTTQTVRAAAKALGSLFAGYKRAQAQRSGSG